jgi:hypothetical protein
MPRMQFDAHHGSRQYAQMPAMRPPIQFEPRSHRHARESPRKTRPVDSQTNEDGLIPPQGKLSKCLFHVAQIGETIFAPMRLFAQSAAVAEPEAPTVDQNVERLAQIEIDLPFKTAARDEIRKNLRELRHHVKDPRTSILPNGLYTAVGAMTMNTPHALVEALQRKADAEVEALLAERAQLMKSLKLIA